MSTNKQRPQVYMFTSTMSSVAQCCLLTVEARPVLAVEARPVLAVFILI